MLECCDEYLMLDQYGKDKACPYCGKSYKIVEDDNGKYIYILEDDQWVMEKVIDKS